MTSIILKADSDQGVICLSINGIRFYVSSYLDLDSAYIYRHNIFKRYPTIQETIISLALLNS